MDDIAKYILAGLIIVVIVPLALLYGYVFLGIVIKFIRYWATWLDKRLFQIIVYLMLLLPLSGCVSTKSMELMTSDKIQGPKVIAIQGTRAAWVYEIEKRLKKQGFQIKRIANTGVSTEIVSSRKATTYKEASAPFILLVDGYAPNNSIQRCFGGGYMFEYIDVEMVDLRSNETILHYNNSGYSEGCPPMSGTIFTDIEKLVSSAWK